MTAAKYSERIEAGDQQQAHAKDCTIRRLWCYIPPMFGQWLGSCFLDILGALDHRHDRPQNLRDIYASPSQMCWGIFMFASPHHSPIVCFCETIKVIDFHQQTDSSSKKTCTNCQAEPLSTFQGIQYTNTSQSHLCWQLHIALRQSWDLLEPTLNSSVWAAGVEAATRSSFSQFPSLHQASFRLAHAWHLYSQRPKLSKTNVWDQGSWRHMRSERPWPGGMYYVPCFILTNYVSYLKFKNMLFSLKNDVSCTIAQMHKHTRGCIVGVSVY